MPWERIVSVCKKYGAYSLVDAAHSIGQHKVNVDEAKCDFFVTVSHTSLVASLRGEATPLTSAELSQMAILVSAVPGQRSSIIVN